MTIEAINLWHQRARPEPTEKHLATQIGCHLEEFLEMITAIEFNMGDDDSIVMIDAFKNIEWLAEMLKTGNISVRASDRKELLDSLADQIVTAVGIGHCAKMDVPKACTEVNKSNWSKFDKDGQPIFRSGGKISKGQDYREPDLSGMY